MSITLRWLFGTLVLASLFLILAGCGSRTKIYEGKLVQGGQPVTVSDQGIITLFFVAEKDKDKGLPYPAETKSDGTFTIKGRDGKGIPPGKYLVSVVAKDPYPNGPDKFGGKFEADKSTLTVEIGKDSMVTVDVGQ
jgi:hypothetical protein